MFRKLQIPKKEPTNAAEKNFFLCVFFTKPALELHNQVRGLIPWPCANATIHGVTLKVHRTAVGEETTAPAGSVVEANKRGIAIACGDGKVLRLLEVQADGGKRMAASAYLAGHPMECDV